MKFAGGVGSYVYIIFAVIYVIYNVIKAGKKAAGNPIGKQPQPSPTVQPPVARTLPEDIKGVDLKKMLEELLGVPQEKMPEKQIVKPAPVIPAVKKNQQIPKKETKPVYEPMHKDPVHSVLSQAHPKVVKKVVPEVVPEAEAEVEFDIRQAIVYSEILKRPEY